MTLTSFMALNTYQAQYACLLNKPPPTGKVVRSIRVARALLQVCGDVTTKLIQACVGGSSGEMGLRSEGLGNEDAVKCFGT